MADSALIGTAAVVAARLIVPLFIPRYPLPAIVIALLLDAADDSLFAMFGRAAGENYQAYDKALDIYYQTIAYAATIRNWGGGAVFLLGRALFYYRLVGVALFEHTDARWLLLLFPNVFEYYFVFIEYIKVARNPFTMTVRQLLTSVAFIWIVIKLPQEWWLHVARMDTTDFVKEQIFAVPAGSSWDEALRNRPLGLVPLLAIAAAIVMAGRQAVRRLPPRIWKPTLSADVQARRIGWPAPPPGAVPSAVFGWPFIEKATLVTLVTLIFSQILPGTRDVLQFTAGTTLVIAATTSISQALQWRGLTWHSITVQFLAILTTTLTIGFAINRLAPAAGHTPPGAFIFLATLHSLIVVLFDRFKRTARTGSR